MLLLILGVMAILGVKTNLHWPGIVGRLLVGRLGAGSVRVEKTLLTFITNLV